ncbi:MAG: LuxR C-terminal-related transcriptional regulator [Candidatus Cyclobacteriaceae bacterium M3_2C_046]
MYDQLILDLIKNYRHDVYLQPQELLPIFKNTRNIAVIWYSFQLNKVIFISHSISKLTGYTPNNFSQHGLKFIDTMIHPDDYNHYYGNFLASKSSLKHRNFSYFNFLNASNQYRFKTKSCEWVWLELSQMIIRYDYQKSMDQILGVLQPVNHVAHHKKYIYKFPGGTSVGQVLDNLPTSPHAQSISIEVSEREKEVLDLISQGFSSKEVADKLNISNHTAITHRKNLITKFKVKNTAELIKEASKSFWFI